MVSLRAPVWSSNLSKYKLTKKHFLNVPQKGAKNKEFVLTLVVRRAENISGFITRTSVKSVYEKRIKYLSKPSGSNLEAF